MSRFETSGTKKVTLLEEILADPPNVEELAALNDEALKTLVALAIRGYVRRLSEDDYLPPFSRDSGVTATDVVAAVSEMLEFVDVEVFELGMWRSWGRV
jgi:hypothetical protein